MQSTTHDLLPCENGDHPPIFLKLSENALKLLRSCAEESKAVNMKLHINDTSKSALTIQNHTFECVNSKESGCVQVFKPFESSFKSCGFINTKIQLKNETSTPNISDAIVDLESPIAVKIVQLLKLKPHTYLELSAKTHASSSMVQSVLNKVAKLENGKYTLVGVKRKVGEPNECAAKRTKHDDMIELANKFQTVYKEYLDLYKEVKSNNSRPQSQVDRLMELHKQLGKWKKTLWDNAKVSST